MSVKVLSSQLFFFYHHNQTSWHKFFFKKTHIKAQNPNHKPRPKVKAQTRKNPIACMAFSEIVVIAVIITRDTATKLPKSLILTQKEKGHHHQTTWKITRTNIMTWAQMDSLTLSPTLPSKVRLALATNNVDPQRTLNKLQSTSIKSSHEKKWITHEHRLQGRTQSQQEQLTIVPKN